MKAAFVALVLVMGCYRAFPQKLIGTISDDLNFSALLSQNRIEVYNHLIRQKIKSIPISLGLYGLESRGQAILFAPDNKALLHIKDKGLEWIGLTSPIRKSFTEGTGLDSSYIGRERFNLLQFSADPLGGNRVFLKVLDLIQHDRMDTLSVDLDMKKPGYHRLGKVYGALSADYIVLYSGQTDNRRVTVISRKQKKVLTDFMSRNLTWVDGSRQMVISPKQDFFVMIWAETVFYFNLLNGNQQLLSISSVSPALMMLTPDNYLLYTDQLKPKIKYDFIALPGATGSAPEMIRKGEHVVVFPSQTKWAYALKQSEDPDTVHIRLKVGQDSVQLMTVKNAFFVVDKQGNGTPVKNSKGEQFQYVYQMADPVLFFTANDKSYQFPLNDMLINGGSFTQYSAGLRVRENGAESGLFDKAAGYEVPMDEKLLCLSVRDDEPVGLYLFDSPTAGRILVVRQFKGNKVLHQLGI